MTEQPKTEFRRQFASDNWSGICPEALEALAAANTGHAPAYGEDEFTRRACDLIRDFFESDCEVFFVFNGTAANSLALATLCQSYHSVVCHEMSHIETDECGAPQFFSNGTKILTVSGDQGKVDLAEVERTILRRTDIHYPKPRVLSLTQPTELGTVYALEELRAARECAKKHSLRVHMDGARFANALVSLGCAPKEIIEAAGADILCFGGSKNGLPIGEAVLFFDRELASEFAFRCKQAGQLGSKMRFLSAPWAGMLEDGAMLRHAAAANDAAKKLEAALRALPGVRIKFPCDANAVFAEMDPRLIAALHDAGWHFYSFIGEGGARFMCSWDTQDEDIAALAGAIRAASRA